MLAGARAIARRYRHWHNDGYLERTFLDPNNPKRQTAAGPHLDAAASRHVRLSGPRVIVTASAHASGRGY